MNSKYDFITTNGELSHHGILGQRWGVRRFQNSDGSLTEEGRSRYGKPSMMGSVKTMINEGSKYRKANIEATKEKRQKNKESKDQLKKGIITKDQHRSNKKANAEEYRTGAEKRNDERLKNIADKTSRGKNITAGVLSGVAGLAGVAYTTYHLNDLESEGQDMVKQILMTNLSGMLLGASSGILANEALISSRGYRNNSDATKKEKNG